MRCWWKCHVFIVSRGKQSIEALILDSITLLYLVGAWQRHNYLLEECEVVIRRVKWSIDWSWMALEWTINPQQRIYFSVSEFILKINLWQICARFSLWFLFQKKYIIMFTLAFCQALFLFSWRHLSMDSICSFWLSKMKKVYWLINFHGVSDHELHNVVS